MVVISPLCPVSFGLLGLLGAVVSRKGTVLQQNQSRQSNHPGEVDNLLTEKSEDDRECDELSEARICNFLESQKSQYYKSIGMEPFVAMKPQQSSMNTTVVSSAVPTPSSELVTPNESMIDFAPPSRELSESDFEDENSSLLALRSPLRASDKPSSESVVKECFISKCSGYNPAEPHITDLPINNPTMLDPAEHIEAESPTWKGTRASGVSGSSSEPISQPVSSTSCADDDLLLQ